MEKMTSRTEIESMVERVTTSLKSLVLEKMKRYGFSAFEPLLIFSKFTPLLVAQNPGMDSILMRLDEKLSRVKNSDHIRKNDIVDILGLLVLLCVQMNWIDFNDLLD
jgi:hypothetical protein